MRRFRSLTCLVLWSLTIACGQKEPPKTPVAVSQAPAAFAESHPRLAAQAQEVTDAFSRRDFARIVDLTYPKLVETFGGRDKMIASMTEEMKQMEAEGVALLSSSAGAPTQILNDSGSIYAVLPTVSKVKAKEGVFQTDGSMIGISADSGSNWTFLDTGGKDPGQLRILLPNVADKLNLPADKPPVKISNSK
jgi:hypothetical protein